jgi:glycosyltransferase involved in cell wall biosynthesis
VINNKKILFVHQNFPGQYKHIAKELVDIGHEVHTLSITKFTDESMTNHHYQLAGNSTKNINRWAVEFESKMIRAGSAANKAIEMKKNGFTPDLIIGHPGWGETFFLKEVWPDTKLLTYAEFFYRTKNSDIDFDPNLIQDDLKIDFESFYSFTKFKLTARNAPFLSTYAVSDYLMSPTNYQKSLMPASLRDNVEVIHDGIDTDLLKPNKDATFDFNGNILTKDSKIVTYISRSLDPYRGFHIFMKALPGILENNPDAYIIIAGNQKTNGYGSPPPDGKTFKDLFYKTIENRIDSSRVKFLGSVDYDEFINLVQITSVHIYLTYPFVLSWSVLEAMSCGALVIGSNTDPVTEVIENEKNGLIVDFFDYDSLVKNVTKVLNNRDNFNDIGIEARKTILKKYDLKKICLPAQLNLIKRALK